VGAATAMGKGAGRSVASAPAVLALLAREAAGAPALAWVSWDDLDAPPAAARATLYPDPGPSAVSEPAAAAPRADGAFLDGLGAAPRSCFEAGSEPAPPPRVAAAHGGESDAARAPETGRAEGGAGSQGCGFDGREEAVRLHSERHAAQGHDRGAAASEAIALLHASLLESGRTL